MKTLIYFPGDLWGPFVEKEYPVLKKYFQRIIVLGNSSKEMPIETLQNMYPYEFHSVSMKLSKLFSVTFIRWLFSYEVFSELKQFPFSLSSFYRFAYVIKYGMYWINIKQFLDYEIVDHPADEIYLYSFWLSKPAYAIAHYRNNSNVKKIISRAHGFDLYTERSKYDYLPFRTFINDNLNEISFISKHGLSYFNQKYHNCNCECKVSYLGSTNDDKTSIASYQKDIVIMSCSNIFSIKRLDIIIDILSKLTIDFHWFHIGDGDLRIKIEKYAAAKLPKNSFTFLGNIPNKYIIETLLKKKANIFINMSDSEGLPVSIMEAISIGLPVIARDVGGIKEIVLDEFGLLLGEEYDCNVYADKIEDFLRERILNEDAFLKMSHEAKKFWEKTFNSWENTNEFFTAMQKK